MSAIICYNLFAKRLIEKQLCPVEDQNAFFFGAQGPQVFSYGMLQSRAPSRQLNNFWQTVDQWDPKQLGEVFAAYLNDPDPETKSYALGIQCHCILEQEIHPFVQYSAHMLRELEQEGKTEDYKNLVESSLDTILLRYETGKLPTEFSMKKAVPASETMRKKAAECYAALYERQIGEPVSTEEIQELLTAGIRRIGKLSDKILLKRQFLKYREKRKKQTIGPSSLYRNISEDEDYDYANVCQCEWQWPLETGEIRTDTFFDLFESAFLKLTEACKIIE